MEPIGGYFELELSNHGGFLHDDGVLLNSGRNALEYVLRALGDVKHLFVPYYTCDVVLEPIDRLDVPYTFYHIGHSLELKDLPSLQRGEYLIYTNYFGIKDEYIKRLAQQYGSQLIIDNAQAWFAKPLEGVSTIYSPRKYVGVPDGGVAYCPKHIEEKSLEQDISYERCSHLLKRLEQDPAEGYDDFKLNSKKLSGQPIKRMSTLTRKMLASIDFESVKNKRITNFNYLHEHLKNTNLLDLATLDSCACPLVYPYLVNCCSLKKHLIGNKVFVATYWPNVMEWCKTEDWEYKLAEETVFIPIDQRYGQENLQRIINTIRSN